ncbi:hypothetical protein CC85DRAFT_301588 [Cutaneotrichosporon oleaginosum]|uniref:Uncharacterized protein n=1 Tax=Cutaneotrichosporon oleaginosum TaxID=879819 RepID=A0A0J1B637_9TREE|nr:uncharacterized protein CC85DRAFT_301588 [Cutaneotrichosporon oleaginosum]KLT43189.1 hypothetical protein CC85DRAFT_301588 [Cutaneotrichosporon oleaginosum]TXT09871.1 hypothetical protein COLE_03805 [Cutaneotrichosporon oleaginosum]
MTSSKQVISRVAGAYALLLFLGSRNQIGRTLWILLNLRDTLCALKEVYPNGRRIGVVTRRRRLRAALAGWIVLVSVQPITMTADTLLVWIPFYSSIKMLIMLALIYWRVESSALLFQAIVVPFVRRYERQIDLTLLLIGSTALFFFHFLIELPYQAVVALVKRPALSAPRTPARQRPAWTVAYPATPSPSHSVSHTEPEPPLLKEAPQALTLTSSPRSPSRRPRGPREHKADSATSHQPRAATVKSAAPSNKPGRVKAAALSFDSSSTLASTSDRERPRSALSERSKRAVAPPRVDDTVRPLKAARPSEKVSDKRLVRPIRSGKAEDQRDVAHSVKVRSALKHLPPAPSHDPRQPIAGPSRSSNSQTMPPRSMSQAEPKRPTRGQKRARPDEEEYEESDASTHRSSHAMSTRNTPRKAKGSKAATASGPAKRATAPRQPATRTRVAATTTKGDTPRVKRARPGKK